MLYGMLLSTTTWICCYLHARYSPCVYSNWTLCCAAFALSKGSTKSFHSASAPSLSWFARMSASVPTSHVLRQQRFRAQLCSPSTNALRNHTSLLRNHTSLLVHPLFLASCSATIPQGHVSQHHRLRYLLEQKCFYFHEPLLGTTPGHRLAWCKDTLMLNHSILLATRTACLFRRASNAPTSS